MFEAKAETIVKQINARFPKAHAKVWNGVPMIGEQSEIDSTVEVDGFEPITTTLPMVDYYGECYSLYPMGIIVEVQEYIDKLGLYGEWHDPGTMCLYEA